MSDSLDPRFQDLGPTNNPNLNQNVPSNTPASTPPLPFPAERLAGAHEKMNFQDFGLAFPFTGFAAAVNAHFTRLQSFGEQTLSNAQQFSAKVLNDAQNLAVKITTDAATMTKTLDSIAVASIQTGMALGQQNLNPVSQGTGESIDAAAYTANRAVDVAAAGQALNADAINAAVAAAFASNIPILAAAISQGVAAVLSAQSKSTGTGSGA